MEIHRFPFDICHCIYNLCWWHKLEIKIVYSEVFKGILLMSLSWQDRQFGKQKFCTAHMTWDHVLWKKSFTSCISKWYKIKMWSICTSNQNYISTISKLVCYIEYYYWHPRLYFFTSFPWINGHISYEMINMRLCIACINDERRKLRYRIDHIMNISWIINLWIKILMCSEWTFLLWSRHKVETRSQTMPKEYTRGFILSFSSRCGNLRAIWITI